MFRWSFIILGIALGLLLAVDSSEGQRGGRGGGARPVGGGGGAARVVGPYGGGGTVQQRTTSPIVGPGGGVVQGGSGSGSYTTKGGSTVNYGGAGYKGTTPGGINYGKGVGGVQVTTPGGKTATKVGTAGNAIGGKSSIGAATGPGGNRVVTGSKSATAIGPGGIVHGGAHGTVANGPYGSAASFSRYRAGPVGAVGHRTTVWPSGAVTTHAAVVRRGFGYYNCFTGGWYTAHPNAWRAAAWTNAAFWTGVTWATLASRYGYPAVGAYYDYGTTIVYEGDQVYINGEVAATAEQYTEQAEQIVKAGVDAQVTDKEDWQSLGVFAMIQGEETDSNNLFQLAINKDGIIRGNYYNGLTDSVTPVEGAVKKSTQRAAWTVGARKDVIYETGLNNLTQPETAMLVHFGRDRTQQWLLVRQDPPPAEQNGP